MSGFLLSASARDDLDSIWCYIATKNSKAADRVERELISAMRQLGKYPHSGHRREDLTARDLRFRSVYSYMIVCDPAMRPVHIWRIISSYRDIKAELE